MRTNYVLKHATFSTRFNRDSCSMITPFVKDSVFKASQYIVCIDRGGSTLWTHPVSFRTRK